jgi:hypothetical protein
VVIVTLQWLGWLVLPRVVPEGAMYGVLGGLAAGPAIVVWWLFFSRAPWPDRAIAVVSLIVAMAVTPLLLHESVARGNMGFQFFLYAIPVVSLAFVLWAVASRRLADGLRRVAMVATILLTCGAFALVRSRGVTGDGAAEFAWRWSETPEERLLVRGPRRPLVHPEQRGEEEIVACHRVTTGEPVWRHSDTTRFWDAHVGAGPRATPTLSRGRVYTLVATGILNALDATDGRVVWSRNVASDTDAKLPTWGFVSSPLVVDDVVIVHARALVAYDLATGERRWVGPRGGSYSSPHLLTIGGSRRSC